jgi:hypothetical protein
MRSGRIAALAEFDALLRRVIACHEPQIPVILEYSPSDLADRLAQRFAQLFLEEFITQYCRAGSESDRQKLQLRGLTLDVSNGSCEISVRLAARLLLDFLLRWCYSAIGLILAIRLGTGKRRATLVYGIGVDDIFREGSDKEFAAYCAAGPISPLSDASTLIVQTAQVRTSCCRRVIYVKSPLHSLCRVVGLGPADAVKLAWLHMAAFARLIRLSVASPAMLLIGRDFAEEATASVLNQSGLIEAIVLTTSNVSSQPLWMRATPVRKFQVHMAWYSQNIRPLVRKSDPELAVYPPNRMIRTDVMWVWTQAFAEYLGGIGIRASMRCVGPILWRLPVPHVSTLGESPLVAVFDVPPVTEAEALRLGELENYYSLDTARKFLQDIVNAAELASMASGQRVRIALKPKRNVTIRRDQRYVRFVEELMATHPNFVRLPAQTSLYELIADSALAISIPFSSPAYIAGHLGRPALFYDPTDGLRPSFEPAQGLAFASTPEALASAISQAVASHPATGRA